jgi:hypothetical protein
MAHPPSRRSLTTAGDTAGAPPAAVSDSSRVGGRFEGLTEIFGIRPLAEVTDPLLGKTIGDVTLLAVIGEGGMGRVYEGRQRAPDRAVAVKVLRPGFITPEGVKRFAREAELLGALHHPHIAQVFWAGACDILGSAVPFIVMEFVAGAVSIIDHARARCLDTAARIRLFRKVCAAVAHGHAAGIVHRDLKPGNILINSADEPKLIDFGIARLAASSGERTALTELGQIIGTVQYMSPEQVAGNDAAIDPRTDVYALGLLLHELLAGRRPYEIDRQRVFDAARIIRERKPVDLVAADGCRLAAGLERVIERCLAIDPGARYADASALAAALDAPAPRAHRRAADRMLWWLAAGATAAAVALVLPRADRPTGSPVETAVRIASDASAVESARKPAPAVRPLTLEQVQAARPVDGILTFHDVAGVPADVAAALVTRGQRLRIYGLETISPELADILGRNRRGVELLTLRAITPDIAASLARTCGPLCLDQVGSLDAVTARTLAGHRDWLNLCGLNRLPDDVLAELVRHEGHGMSIRLPGALDAGRAEIIARHQGILYLVGLDTVELEAAKILGHHRGRVIVDAARLTPEVDRLLGGIQ